MSWILPKKRPFIATIFADYNKLGSKLIQCVLHKLWSKTLFFISRQNCSSNSVVSVEIIDVDVKKVANNNHQ